MWYLSSDKTITPSVFANNIMQHGGHLRLIFPWLMHLFIHRNKLHFKCDPWVSENSPAVCLPLGNPKAGECGEMSFLISMGPFLPPACHLQHCFFSTCRTLLHRGHVWYASLKLFMKNGIRQQHRTNLQHTNRWFHEDTYWSVFFSPTSMASEMKS